MTQESSAVAVAPIIEERDTNLLFLRVIPNAKKPIMKDAHEVVEEKKQDLLEN